MAFSGALPNRYLCHFKGKNTASNGSNYHVVANELDSVMEFEFKVIDDNHVGIGIDSPHSNNSLLVGYFTDEGKALRPVMLALIAVIQCRFRFYDAYMIKESSNCKRFWLSSFLLQIFSPRHDFRGRVDLEGEENHREFRGLGGSFLLQQACSKVVPAIEKYWTDPTSPEDKKRHVIDLLCKPLSKSILRSQENLSSRAALCLKALMESDN
ncbi:hypothetical protein V6N12_023322 [Hibiscus sabdariffa]|uniref:Legume lectin domain-containing protein n=1 Tax=Hibiscus sabdariffa TaxID=183260 RepID=A0ABR2FXC7_9ROSI